MEGAIPTTVSFHWRQRRKQPFVRSYGNWEFLLNGRGVDFDSILSNGDRIALFPPEMAFNMYVALSFRRDLIKKNID
jgi:hypothetical protein